SHSIHEDPSISHPPGAGGRTPARGGDPSAGGGGERRRGGALSGHPVRHPRCAPERRLDRGGGGGRGRSGVGPLALLRPDAGGPGRARRGNPASRGGGRAGPGGAPGERRRMSRRARSAGWYRRLLRLLPEEFRRRHGREMERVFEELDRRAPPGRARMALWTEAVRDVARAAWVERMRVVRG